MPKPGLGTSEEDKCFGQLARATGVGRYRKGDKQTVIRADVHSYPCCDFSCTRIAIDPRRGASWLGRGRNASCQKKKKKMHVQMPYGDSSLQVSMRWVEQKWERGPGDRVPAQS